MFGVDSSELLIVAVLALIFIGPKELPSTLRTVGQWVGRIRAHARHFTAGIENIMREAELEEMEKRWREENERIMREYPMGAAGTLPPLADEQPPLADLSEPPPFDRASDPDEPGLPLPEPDYSRRQLP